MNDKNNMKKLFIPAIMLFTISCSDSEESVLEVAENQENQTD